MSLLTDRQIMRLAVDCQMISPFEPKQIRRIEDERIISYGLSSAGYDLRLANHFMMPAQHVGLLDPKNMDETCYENLWSDEIIIAPGMTVLGVSLEELRIPENVHCLVVGKSTYARVGIHVLTTPAEPGWFGKLTIEISNLNRIPAKIYANEGICQMTFFELDSKPMVTYTDRQGKYNGQTTTTIAKV